MTVDTTLLVRAACAGDHQAFTKLVERASGHVRFVIGRRVGREHVDDLVQETYLDAWRSIGSLRDPRTFHGWLVRLAFGCANRWLKRQQYERAALPKLAVSEETVDPTPESGWSDPVLRALDTLDPEARSIVLLRHRDGLSTQEVATALNLTADNVSKRLCRARAKLGRLLKPNGELK